MAFGPSTKQERGALSVAATQTCPKTEEVWVCEAADDGPEERLLTRLLFAETFFPAKQIVRKILRRLRDPSSRIIGYPVIGPGPKRPNQRFLDHILGQLQMVNSKDARQDRNQLSGLNPEKMLGQPGNFPGWHTAVILQLAHAVNSVERSKA